jgi:hypothetical protein
MNDKRKDNMGGPPIHRKNKMNEWTPPISCMMDYLNDADCNSEICWEKRQAAAKAFIETTGYQPPNYDNVFANIEMNLERMTDFNAGYIFTPIFLLILIVIWLAVGFGWFNWVVGLFMSVLAWAVLYGSAVLYRVQAKTYIRNSASNNAAFAKQLQSDFADTIAYWPQGMFAIACAVTNDGWQCNENMCKKKECRDGCDWKKPPMIDDPSWEDPSWSDKPSWSEDPSWSDTEEKPRKPKWPRDDAHIFSEDSSL